MNYSNPQKKAAIGIAAAWLFVVASPAHAQFNPFRPPSMQEGQAGSAPPQQATPSPAPTTSVPTTAPAATQTNTSPSGAASTKPGLTPVPAAAPSAPPAPVAAALQALETQNPFDPQRKLWPDRVPPPPPPPAPPAPAAISDQDLQLYGVVIVGNVKRATVKLGPRFTPQGQPQARAFMSLTEGQALGEFSIAEIQPTHIVLTAQGSRQQVYFSKKSDRGTASASASLPPPPVIQTATPVEPVVAPPGTAPTQNPGFAQNNGGNAAMPPAAFAPPVAADSSGNNAQGISGAAPTTLAPGVPAPAGSLAAAIAAAQARSANQGGTNTTPPANPFLARPAQ